MARPLETVILDVDGTLVDSNELHLRAWLEAAAEQGIELDAPVVRTLIGMRGDRLVAQATRLAGDEPIALRMQARQGELFLERYLPQVRAFPKARELVERIRAAGAKVVVASSSGPEKLSRLLEAAGVQDLVTHRPPEDEDRKSKPDPDLVRAALEVTQTAPEAAVMVGDTPWDVAAAAQAGVEAIALRSGGWSDEGLAGAAALYDDVADLLAHWAQSPLGRRLAEHRPESR